MVSRALNSILGREARRGSVYLIALLLPYETSVPKVGTMRRGVL
jgi:hypothetical protein